MTGRFGRFQIIRSLGQGGMSNISLAELRGPRGFRKRLALKRLLPSLLDRPELRLLFESEARICGLLEHSNLVRAYEYGLEEGEPYIAFELVQGVTLRNLLHGLSVAKRPMPLGAVLHVARCIASALSYAHSLTDLEGRRLRLVHRDISSANTLLSWPGEVKVADFGVARHDASTFQSVPGAIRGRFAYMAPEQADGEEIDGRTDLFSLGVLVYECLAGHRPFERANDLEGLRAAHTHDIPPLLDARPGIPVFLAELVTACLHPNLSQRPCSADQFLRHLRAVERRIDEPADALALADILAALRLQWTRPVIDVGAETATHTIRPAEEPPAGGARLAVLGSVPGHPTPATPTVRPEHSTPRPSSDPENRRP